MTKEKVIQTLIDDYSKQAKLSKREQTIFEHGLLTGIQIGSIEEPEVDLEKEIIRVSKNEYFDFTDWKSIARHFFELGMSVSNKSQKEE